MLVMGECCTQAIRGSMPWAARGDTAVNGGLRLSAESGHRLGHPSTHDAGGAHADFVHGDGVPDPQFLLTGPQSSVHLLC